MRPPVQPVRVLLRQRKHGEIAGCAAVTATGTAGDPDILLASLALPRDGRGVGVGRKLRLPDNLAGLGIMRAEGLILGAGIEQHSACGYERRTAIFRTWIDRGALVHGGLIDTGGLFPD